MYQTVVVLCQFVSNLFYNEPFYDPWFLALGKLVIPTDRSGLKIQHQSFFFSHHTTLIELNEPFSCRWRHHLSEWGQI